MNRLLILILFPLLAIALWGCIDDDNVNGNENGTGEQSRANSAIMR